MIDENVFEKSIPLSVQLLFENTRLDVTKAILLLYAYSLQKNTGMKIPEITFYYSLVNFDLINLFLPGEKISNVFMTNRFLRYELRINYIVLQLSQLNFIEVNGNVKDQASDIRVSITPSGVSFVYNLDSRYFKTLVDKYVYALNTVEFSPANLRTLKGGSR